jgi:hypothetical protein
VRSVVVTQRPDYSGDLDFRWLAVQLARPELHGVRSLYWGSDDGSCFVEVPDLAEVLEAMPQLESLELQGTWFTDTEELATTGLRHLALNALDGEELEAVTELDLSNIERLTLWLYDHENEGSEELLLEELEALWDVPMPRLRELVLHACEFSDELVTAFPDSPIFAQLERLGLVGCTNTGSFLGEDAAEALLSEAYSDLLSIDVTGSFSDPRREASPLLERLVSESAGRVNARQYAR